jgi:hypothetical protein
VTAVSAREIDEDMAHHAGGCGEKMRPVIQFHCVRFDEPQKGLVHKRRRLEDVAGRLPPHVKASLSSQFLVQQR